MKIGLLGLGTVGSNVVKLLRENKDEIIRRLGAPIEITHAAAKEINRKRLGDIGNIELTTDPLTIINNPNIDIIIEVMGGDASEFVKQALVNGKHVVSANKAMLAEKGNELIELAHQHKVSLLFEAAVAGGIPIINVLKSGLNANRIDWLAGIINGTGNFILTEMQAKSRDFDDVLTEAQALGYAEQDPSFDVDGIDAAHKLAILSALAFGTTINFDAVFIEGIRDISPLDVKFAGELGYTIKHLGITKQSNDGIEMRVHPTLLPHKRLLANVDGVMNAVLVKGNAVGPTLYYGAGAGGEPTASAVVADVMSVVAQKDCHSAFAWQQLKTAHYQSIDQVDCAHYLRFEVADEAGVLADITQILAQHNISVDAVIQKKRNKKQQYAMIAMVTNHCLYEQAKHAIAQIAEHDYIHHNTVHILVETLN